MKLTKSAHRKAEIDDGTQEEGKSPREGQRFDQDGTEKISGKRW